MDSERHALLAFLPASGWRHRWAERWPALRAALKAPNRVPDVRDHDSLGSFCDLVEEFSGTGEHTAVLRALIRHEASQGIGVS
ncbi:hypothetical protein [Streptomyces sp. NPDC057623]|uniref:hypothetical protein n=1 Tax=Streptomyces sp. NPDC057623 TaxID=3346187 RepID=UPI0036A29018